MTKSFTYEYPRPSLTVDLVVFGVDLEAQDLQILLIRRGDKPFKGMWALPGGFVNVSDKADQGETLEDAARRELAEETDVRVRYLEQLYTFATPGRDPRGRVVSVAYLTLARTKDLEAHAGSDAADVRWYSVKALPELAFDHAEIIEKGLARLRAKVTYEPLGFDLLPLRFTLTELQTVYEIVLGRTLDKRNFRKRILAMGILREDPPARHGATVYQFDAAAYEAAQRRGFNFQI